MMANPTVTSAAATTMMKNTNICPSEPALEPASEARPARWCIFENATSKIFTAFSINSIHMKITIAFRLVKTPAMPMQNKATERKI